MTGRAPKRERQADGDAQDDAPHDLSPPSAGAAPPSAPRPPRPKPVELSKVVARALERRGAAGEHHAAFRKVPAFPRVLVPRAAEAHYPTDDGVVDDEDDEDEGETRGSGPRLRRSKRSVAPMCVHTGADGEKTLATTTTTAKATREGPHLIFVYLRLSNERATPEETLRALLGQLFLILGALFLMVGVGDGAARPLDISVYADVGVSGWLTPLDQWPAFMEMCDDIRAARLTNERARITVVCADVSRLGRLDDRPVRCVEMLREAGADEVIVTFDWARERDLVRLPDGVLRLRGGDGGTEGRRRPTGPTVPYSVAPPGLILTPLLRAAAAGGRDNARRTVLRRRMNRELAHRLHMCDPSDAVSAVAKVLAVRYQESTPTGRTPMILVVTRASPTTENGKGVCARQQARVLVLADAVVEEHGKRYPNAPSMTVACLGVYGTDADSGAYPERPSTMLARVRPTVEGFGPDVHVFPMFSTMDRVARDPDTVGAFADWRPVTVAMAPEVLLPASGSVATRAARLASLVAGVPDPNGDLLRARDALEGVLTAVLATAGDPNGDAPLLPVVLTREIIDKTPGLPEAMENLALEAHALSSTRALEFVHDPALHGPLPSDPVDPEVAVDSVLRKAVALDRLRRGEQQRQPVVQVKKVRVVVSPRTPRTPAPPLGGGVAPPAKGERWALLQQHFRNISPPVPPPRGAPADPPADPPADRPADPPAEFGLFGFGARPAEFAAAPTRGRPPPRAREGPCDVCKDLPSPITRGRCGAAVGSLRTCLRRPECQMTIVKIEALLEQCGGDERPSPTTTVVPPVGRPFKAHKFLRSISTNWRLLVLDSVGDGVTYAHLTADRMSELEARAPAWLKDLIVRWRTPPCAACAAHPNRSLGARCGTAVALLGCSLRPQR